MLSPALAAVVEVPELGALHFRVPAVLRGAEREDPLLGPRFLLVAPRAAERGVEAVLVERLLERLGLHDVGVQRRAVGERVDAPLDALRVLVDDQLDAVPLGATVSRNSYIARNFQVVSTCSSGNGGLAG